MKKSGFITVFFTAAVLIGSVFGGTELPAQTVDLKVSVSNPYLLAGQRQSVFLKVGLTGFELDGRVDRPPANVSIVLDKSGSMEGEKLVRAKEAALLAVEMLGDRDIVSVVTYSDTVSVLVPATRVSERSYIRRRIESIFAGGSTALFAGVSKGADEVSKFLERNKVNRVILLSDGLANVGPDSPMALGSLGESLKRTRISVTTIGLGLGYNEDLMVALAERSDGNHAFVENYRDLTRIFQYEFQDILSVVAQDVEIEIICDERIVPRRILGRNAEIIGNRVYTTLNQLYSNQEKYLLIELEVPPFQEGEQIDAARVSIQYDNMGTYKSDYLTGAAAVSFTRSKQAVDEAKDRETLVDAVKQIATERSEEAISLRDKGQVEEARRVLQANSEFLQEEAEELASSVLEGLSRSIQMDAAAIEDDAEWNSNRKRMKKETYEVQNQQSY
jgi:Ca-activated chloride channel homolog